MRFLIFQTEYLCWGEWNERWRTTKINYAFLFFHHNNINKRSKRITQIILSLVNHFDSVGGRLLSEQDRWSDSTKSFCLVVKFFKQSKWKVFGNVFFSFFFPITHRHSLQIYHRNVLIEYRDEFVRHLSIELVIETIVVQWFWLTFDNETIVHIDLFLHNATDIEVEFEDEDKRFSIRSTCPIFRFVS